MGLGPLKEETAESYPVYSLFPSKMMYICKPRGKSFPGSMILHLEALRIYCLSHKVYGMGSNGQREYDIFNSYLLTEGNGARQLGSHRAFTEMTMYFSFCYTCIFDERTIKAAALRTQQLSLTSVSRKVFHVTVEESLSFYRRHLRIHTQSKGVVEANLSFQDSMDCGRLLLMFAQSIVLATYLISREASTRNCPPALDTGLDYEDVSGNIVQQFICLQVKLPCFPNSTVQYLVTSQEKNVLTH